MLKKIALLISKYALYHARLGGTSPCIYQCYLPVFTALDNTPQVVNTDKYWSIEIFMVVFAISIHLLM